MSTSIESRRISLLPVSSGDNKLLFNWRNQLDYLKLVAPKRTVVSFGEFEQEQKGILGRSGYLQFVIWKKNNPCVAVGTIYIFNLNLIDGHAFVNLYIDQEWRGQGFGPEAGMLLSCHYFDFSQFLRYILMRLDIISRQFQQWRQQVLLKKVCLEDTGFSGAIILSKKYLNGGSGDADDWDNSAAEEQEADAGADSAGNN